MKTVYYWYKTFANVYTCKYACSLYKIMFTNIVRGGFIIMVLKLEQSSIYYSSDLNKKRNNSVYTILIYSKRETLCYHVTMT